jgi:hypothetical protein
VIYSAIYAHPVHAGTYLTLAKGGNDRSTLPTDQWFIDGECNTYAVALALAVGLTSSYGQPSFSVASPGHRCSPLLSINRPLTLNLAQFEPVPSKNAGSHSIGLNAKLGND